MTLFFSFKRTDCQLVRDARELTRNADIGDERTKLLRHRGTKYSEMEYTALYYF